MAAEFLKTHGIDLQGEMSKVQFGDASSTPESPTFIRRKVGKIQGVRLPNREPDSRWDISIEGKAITSIKPHDPQNLAQTSDPEILEARDCFLTPSLCHPHVHLDKCFLLNDPKYADLSIEKGDFAQALSLTSKAKSRFSLDDLLRRGRWLIEESIEAGVTCMRAFVEVDATVRFKCLDAALTLKAQYRDACEIEICVFAQDPIFTGENALDNRDLIEEALQRDGVEVLGSTPYVEADEARMRKNVDWAVDAAWKYDKHLDLHLDYNLNANKEPLIWYVIARLHRRQHVSKKSNRTIVLGHCTRLTSFTADQWHDLRRRIGDLPVSFVGLPTSDLFMMGKPSDEAGGGERVRGTLQMPQMIQQYRLAGAIGINNVGNAFTPQGNCDPLSLASTCVGIYQAGTKKETELLYECVSQRAKAAIGCGDGENLGIHEGGEADLIIFDVGNSGRRRGRRTLQELVYDPPERRIVMHEGNVITLESD
ncbi:MAG: hypothetical protein LQ350_005385 [Teloschistes chrysophthalmus]|nr:MAG: hypothetical protein LQ350_005385 [Niorma chrysophthalma]